MSILLVGEHHDTTLSPATLSALSAARQLGDDIHILIAGEACQEAANQAAKAEGVTKVLCVEDACFAHRLAESFAPLLQRLASGYSHILFPATSFGKNIMPRAAALLDVQPLSDVTKVIDAQTFERPVYAGNAVATVQSTETPVMLSVRSSAFDAAASAGSDAALETLGAEGCAQQASAFVSQELSQSERPELTAARIVVSGGRGVGSAENFAIIEALADKLGAAVGASRAAVDAGYVPNDYQVGQTGKVVAPDLYIAIGISGAIQHLAGMKESKTIVAINTDEDAPIFQVADYGLVMDLFDAVPALTNKL